MPKAIYLTSRKPGFDHDQFVKRWREHGALAMSKGFFKNMLAYSQAEIIQPAVLPGTTQDFDAIAFITMRPYQHSQSDLDELQEMIIDEHETFVRPIAPNILQVDERIVTAGPPGGFTACLFFLDEAAAEPVALHYGRAGANRVVLNTRRDDLTVGELSSMNPYRGVVEVSAPNPDALKAILGLESDAPWRQADLAAITRECVMWDRLS